MIKIPRRKQEGWVYCRRKDPRTGQQRMIKILYKNGKEVEKHWITADINKTNKAVEKAVEIIGEKYEDEIKSDPEMAIKYKKLKKTIPKWIKYFNGEGYRELERENLRSISSMASYMAETIDPF